MNGISNVFATQWRRDYATVGLTVASTMVVGNSTTFFINGEIDLHDATRATITPLGTHRTSTRPSVGGTS